LLPKLTAGFLGNTLSYRSGSDTSRLGVTDHAGNTQARLQTDFGKLGGFTRASLTGHDDDLVLLYQGADPIRLLTHGQARRWIEIQVCGRLLSTREERCGSCG
jgi:hypothetical protein